LTFDVSGSTVNKGRLELRRHGTAIENAERSVANFVEVGRAFKRRVEPPPCGANAGLTRPAGQSFDNARIRRRRVGQSYAWSKIVITGRSEGAGNSGIAWEYPSSG